MKTMALSSEIYNVKTDEIKALSAQELPLGTVKALPILKADEIVVFLNPKGKDFIISGKEIVNSTQKAFIPVRFAYVTYSPFVAFFINLFKFVKRRFYTVYSSIYTIKLDDLINNNLTRGVRNAQNAYQWGNKKWQIPPQEAKKRYADLYNSIKTNGYNYSSPMLILLNRKLGIKDQMLQGHHRVGICQDLDITEVTVSFWTVPKSYNFMKLFIKGKTHENNVGTRP